jgi:hypothetical protein
MRLIEPRFWFTTEAAYVSCDISPHKAFLSLDFECSGFVIA